MHALVAFLVAEPDGSSPSICTVSGTNLQIHASTTSVKIEKLDEMRDQLLELLGQDVLDGKVDSQKITVGGRADGSDLLLAYVHTSDTFTIASLGAWSRVKTTKLCEALVAYGLVAP
jgi:hypothetical protein